MSAAEIRAATLEAVLQPDQASESRVVLDPRDPLAIARRVLAERFAHEASGWPLLRSWRGDLRGWTGTHYPVVEDAGVRAALYEYLECAHRPAKGDTTEPFRPTAAAVNNVLDALRAAAHLDGSVPMPSWLEAGARREHPHQLLACRNGLLDLQSRKLLPHTPGFFCGHALPYDYVAAGPEPAEWLEFLYSLWPHDPEAAETLQEIFGYVLSGETRQQKLFLLVGPKRSGKGTIARVLRALLGEVNVAGPTLSALATNFGLQSLIDRPLAIVSDARLSGRADQAVIVERLLSVSGEDVLTVDRKHREPWIGQLPTRILVLTNELPRLADTSGALASRFLVLTLTNSWYGHEDVRLFDRLLPELPGILRWALDGLDRLRARGHFRAPQSSTQAVEELEDLASPVGAFLRECCDVEPGAEIEMAAVYARWRRWCDERGREHPGTEQTFGRDLRAAIPAIGRGDRRASGERFRVYVGLRLKGA